MIKLGFTVIFHRYVFVLVLIFGEVKKPCVSGASALGYPYESLTLYTHLWKTLYIEEKGNKATKTPRHKGTLRSTKHFV